MTDGASRGRAPRRRRRPLPLARAAAALVVAALLLAPSLAAAQPFATPPDPAAPAAPGSIDPPLVPEAPEPADGTAAPAPAGNAPFIRIDVGGDEGGGQLGGALKIIALLGLMTFLPAIMLAMTSFTRIIVVLGLLRQAVGVPQLPPTRVLVGLALFMTIFTMRPVFEQVYDNAIVPYEAGELDEGQALDAALDPLKRFMLMHTREDDLLLFVSMAEEERPATALDVSTLTLVPAFMLSELKTAFQIGALLFLPFLVIDIAVASVLMSMGMMMLPPATISMPLKILVFVAVDGWALVARSLTTGLWGG